MSISIIQPAKDLAINSKIMITNQEKVMQSLMQKLDQLETEKEVQLTPEEAVLYQADTMDELPFEDHFGPKNDTEDGS